MALHASTVCGDDLLRRFWEIEEPPLSSPATSLEGRSVVRHFETNHSHTKSGRFIMPLPDAKPIGESRSQAVRRFLALERSLHHKERFQSVMKEYLDLRRLYRSKKWASTLLPCSTYPHMSSTRALAQPLKSERYLMLLQSLIPVCLLMIPFLLGLPSILHSSTFY